MSKTIKKKNTIMILSMTGFGKGVVQASNLKITVEIKSLNSKQLDISTRTPGIFREADLQIRQLIGAELQRGKIDAIVQAEDTEGSTPVVINNAVVRQYKDQIMALASELQIAWPSDWYATLLRLPDVLKSQACETTAEQVQALLEAARMALSALVDFRTTEGKKLELFFVEKIKEIGELLTQVEPFEQERITRVREKLRENLERLESVEYDRGRLEQELIFYIEKLDVTEEKTRLRAHLAYFLETLALPEPGQGKKLGFIAQEMGREINTLGSKSNNADMQRIVVKMKDALEQIKEQVLNVL